jgi:hypothetical protein
VHGPSARGGTLPPSGDPAARDGSAARAEARLWTPAGLSLRETPAALGLAL